MAVIIADWQRYTLPDDLRQYALWAATRRHANGFGKGLAGANNLDADKNEALNLDVAGILGEAACYGWLGGKAAGVVWNSAPGNWTWTVPDIVSGGFNIDVKARPRNDRGLNVIRDPTMPHFGINPGWMYVLTSTQDDPVFNLIGWAWGTEVLTMPVKEWQAGRPCFFMDQDDELMKPMRTLRWLCLPKQR